ncbi:MAG TPA: hypothetical protein VMJ10_04165 [Kofleriaceae bacterium]|nr:hypothetical protein [Kofleriaceae bacterium]
MSSVGGPGGIGGPKGPHGPGATEGAGEADEIGESAEVERGERAGAGELDRIAADVAAGKLTAREAVDRMVDQMAGSQHLEPGERAELRELLTELVANDPYLSGLLGRI